MVFKQLQNHSATRKNQKRNTQNEHNTLGDVACQTHYRLTYNCTLRSDWPLQLISHSQFKCTKFIQIQATKVHRRDLIHKSFKKGLPWFRNTAIQNGK